MHTGAYKHSLRTINGTWHFLAGNWFVWSSEQHRGEASQILAPLGWDLKAQHGGTRESFPL